MTPFISNLIYFESYWFPLLICFVFGSYTGSFAYSYSLKILKDKGSLIESSKCKNCNKKLLWWHIIPIISFFLLNRKCYFCKNFISIEGLVVEILTGFLFYLNFYFLDLQTAFWSCLIASFLIIIIITDLKQMIIHMPTLYFLSLLGLMYNFFIFNYVYAISYSFISFFVGWFLIYSISYIFYFLRGYQGFGDGDKWLLGSLGIFFGFYDVIYIFIYSCWLGSILGIFFYIKNKNFLFNKIPIGSILCFISLIFYLFE